MEPTANQYNTAALLRDRGDPGLVIGQVGTTVEIYAPDAFEVGFCTTQFTSIALTKLARTDFLVVRHDAVLAA